MKRSLLVIKAEIVKQQQHDYHSWFVYLSLLVWPILGFFEVYYTYKPFEFTEYMGITNHKELLAFLGTGFCHTHVFGRWFKMRGQWRIRSEGAGH